MDADINTVIAIMECLSSSSDDDDDELDEFVQWLLTTQTLAA